MSDQIDPSVAATPSDADSSPAMMDPSASPPAAPEAATDPGSYVPTDGELKAMQDYGMLASDEELAKEPAVDHPLAYLGGPYKVLADYIIALEEKVAKAMGWA